MSHLPANTPNDITALRRTPSHETTPSGRTPLPPAPSVSLQLPGLAATLLGSASLPFITPGLQAQTTPTQWKTTDALASVFENHSTIHNQQAKPEAYALNNSVEPTDAASVFDASLTASSHPFQGKSASANAPQPLEKVQTTASTDMQHGVTSTTTELGAPDLAHRWATWLEWLNIWWDAGPQGALALASNQLPQADAWLLQARMERAADQWTNHDEGAEAPAPIPLSPREDASPSSEAGSSAPKAATDTGVESQSTLPSKAEINGLQVQTSAPNPSSVLLGTDGDDVLLVAEDRQTVRAGGGQDLVLLAGQKLSLYFGQQDLQDGPDTVLGYWQGADRFVLELPQLPQGALESAHFINDLNTARFTGQAEIGHGPMVVMSHWNGTEYQTDRIHLWVDPDGQHPHHAHHFATLLGIRALTTDDFMVVAV